MKIKIKKELLLENLNKVSKAISTKNLIPILSGIKFDLTKEGLTLTASDNDITIQTFIPADNKEMEIEKEGSIIIQGKYVLDIVRKLPDEFVNIEVIDELKILIYAENSEFNLNGINQKEYPNVALENSKNFVKINTKLFKTIINQTAFATSTDESRPICKNIVEFMKILNEGNEELEIHIFSNKVLFKQNNLLFQSRLVSGNYPNVNNLIPSDSFLKITANLSNLYDVIDRASILTSDKEKNIVTLETNKNLLIVRSSSAEIGRVEEKMNITKDNEEEIKISFSAKYMMDALRSFEGDTVELAFEGEVKPIIIKDVEDPNLTQLVLPIRTY